MQERPGRPNIYGRRCRRWRWRNTCKRTNMRWSYDYEWVVMIIVKLASWLCFGVGYQIIVWCLLLVGDWWCELCGDELHLIMPIWFNLFQIDSSIITIQNSYALQGRSLRIAVKDWYRVLTDELLCTPPLNGRVDNCELHCLALFTLGYRHVPSRNVEAALCVKYVGHDKRGNCDFISMMGNSG
jgi:hypothetical protein